jgi:hypothetical protein
VGGKEVRREVVRTVTRTEMVAQARALAEAVRGCGGIDAFLKRSDLVAEIIGSDTAVTVSWRRPRAEKAGCRAHRYFSSRVSD